MKRKRTHEDEIDINVCCFCKRLIEWQDDWCEHGSTVPAEVAHAECCHICSEMPGKELADVVC